MSIANIISDVTKIIPQVKGVSSKDLAEQKQSTGTSLQLYPTTTTPSPNSTISTATGDKSVIRVIFEKTIELDELSIPAAKTNKSPKVEDSMSIEFPVIRINNYIFNREEIRSVQIDSTGFLPKITLNIALANQLFIAKEMPKDGDIISLAIRNGSDVLKIIRNDYVITGVHTLPNVTNVTGPVIMSFFGELFVPGLKSQKNDMSIIGTSFEALQDFAKKYGLGFSTNEDNTDDKQLWLKANMSADIFANTVTSRAWKDSDSFYSCWIDLYYNLNFVNINKQLMSAESSVDIAALVSNLDKNYTYGADTDEDKTTATVKVFSNFPDFINTPFYIKTWRPFNRSSAITFQIGTKMTCEMFEHNQGVYSQPDASKYWTVQIEPTYDKEKAKKMILLRGRASYKEELDQNGKNLNPDLKRANYNYVDIYEKFPWLGVQYTVTNPDDDISEWNGNQHQNYHVAKVKNFINNKELDKLNLHIEVVGNNFNIIRGDKLPVALIRTDPAESSKIHKKEILIDALDLFYSGWFFVKGFKVYWNAENEGKPTSNFKQEFILTRREWPAPIAVAPIPEETIPAIPTETNK